MENLILYLIAINLVTFFVYGWDKQKAKRHAWRVSEDMLLTLAVIGGSIGAFLGMQLFRHKTKHLKFVIGVPLIFLIQIGIAAYFMLWS